MEHNIKNVILLTVDTLRKDALGCYGDKNGLGPFIDSLQDKCIKFTRAQASGSYTQASFPGLLTSSYYLDCGKPSGLGQGMTLVSEPLQKAGIVTAAFHSNPYISGILGWNRGWDVFYDSMQDQVEPRIPYVRGNIINTKVSNWVSLHTIGSEYKPFFLWFHYMDVHEPYMPEKQYLDLVDPSLSISRDEMYGLFTDTLRKRDASDPVKVGLLKKLYNAHVREIDAYIQGFFGTLEKLGILKDTIVIMTSDHGDEFGEHGGLSHDDKLYSELIDVPLLIYDPNRDRGETCHTLVSNIDISPTIIHLFGIEPVANFKGHSLLPLGSYPQNGALGEAIDQRSVKGGDVNKDVYYYREDDLKIIYHAGLDIWEMYDLKRDPKEQNNIINVSSSAEHLKGKIRPFVRRWVSKQQ